MCNIKNTRCIICNNEIELSRKGYKRKKYCSQECYYKRPPDPSLIKKCECCGIIFSTTRQKISKGGGRFCSRKCFRKIHRGENCSGWNGGKVEIICKICGIKFKIIRSRAEKGKVLYCSHKCQGVASSGSGSCRWKDREERKCIRCGTYFEFSDYPSLRGKATGEYCSPGCYAKNRGGSKNPNWKNGKTGLVMSLRTSVKYKEWRESVYSRDNYSCVKCEKKSCRDLNAHHINPISLILQDNNIFTLQEAFALPILWDIKNGETLCEDCHKKVHNKKWKYVKRPKRL